MRRSTRPRVRGLYLRTMSARAHRGWSVAVVGRIDGIRTACAIVSKISLERMERNARVLALRNLGLQLSMHNFQ